MRSWDGVRMQDALLGCEIVSEQRMTDARAEHWYFLKLDDKIIPLGYDKDFADTLEFALRRNAETFERRTTQQEGGGA
jgi:hypothetical protein